MVTGELTASDGIDVDGVVGDGVPGGGIVSNGDGVAGDDDEVASDGDEVADEFGACMFVLKVVFGDRDVFSNFAVCVVIVGVVFAGCAVVGKVALVVACGCDVGEFTVGGLLFDACTAVFAFVEDFTPCGVFDFSGCA